MEMTLKELLVKSKGYKCPVCHKLFNTVNGYWAHARWHIHRWKLLKIGHRGLSRTPCPICDKKVRWSGPYVLERLTPYHPNCFFKKHVHEV